MQHNKLNANSFVLIKHRKQTKKTALLFSRVQ